MKEILMGGGAKMANNQSLQILRGSGHSSSTVLLDGQPYYDKENRYLYIGNGRTALSGLSPVTTNDIAGSRYVYLHKTMITIKNTSVDNVYLYPGWDSSKGEDAVSTDGVGFSFGLTFFSTRSSSWAPNSVQLKNLGSWWSSCMGSITLHSSTLLADYTPYCSISGVVTNNKRIETISGFNFTRSRIIDGGVSYVYVMEIQSTDGNDEYTYQINDDTLNSATTVTFKPTKVLMGLKAIIE